MRTVAPQAAERIDPDLRRLVDRAGSRLVAARELTTLRSSVLERPAWRLELGDGRSFKGRVFASAEEAARFRALHAWLPSEGFPALQAATGRAVLLDWVGGLPLPEPAEPALLRRCGGLLAGLHCVALPPDAADRYASGPTRLPHPLDAEIEEIAAAGRLTPLEAARLRTLAEASQPDRPVLGLVHLDFCAENLVVTPDGSPVAVDNATLCVAPLDYDLGRTWYRWPMSAARRGAFLEGYRRLRDPGGFQAAFVYWRVCALVHSAQLRIRRRTAGVAEPVAQLRRLLAWAEAADPRALRDPERLAALP